MGTQFQRLSASRAWDPEAVQADSAWHLGAHHVVSQARLQLPRGFRRPPRPREEQHVWPWQPKRDPDRHRPLCPQSALRGFHCPAVGSAPGTSWDLTLTLTLPRTGTLPRDLSLPRSLILHLSRLLAWALTSAVAAKDGSWPAPSLVPSTQTFRETTALVCVRCRGPHGPNPNTNRTTNQDPPPKVKPASKPNPAIEHPPLRSCNLPWLIMSDPLRASSPGAARLGPPHLGLSLTMAHHA